MKKFLLLCLTCFMLVGCLGGGGGSSSKDKSKDDTSGDTPIEKIQVLAFEVDENEKVWARMSSVPNNYTIRYDNTFLDVSIEAGAIFFNAKEVDSPVTVKVTVADNETSKIVFDALVTVLNTSGDVIVERAQVLTSSYKDLAELANDRRLYFYLIDGLYLVEYYNNSDVANLRNEFMLATSYSGTKSTILLLGEQLIMKLHNYSKGFISESELTAIVTDLDNAIKEHGELTKPYLDEAVSLSLMEDAWELSTLSYGELTYRNKDKVYSRFIGTSEYGDYVNGVWEFNSEYSFLDDFVNLNYTGRMCTI